jgi:phosphoglucomutase
MDYRKAADRWLQFQDLDQDLRRELERITDEKEWEDRFYTSLTFGTAGLRGVIGAGTNRMNRYTVRKATQGLAQFILKQGEEARKKGVVIAYDCRHQSPEFAKEAGLVLAQNGIKAYVFDELRPTPELSFAVRYLGTAAGIMITASHNPPEYNGYKVYGPDGAQIAADMADAVMGEIERVPNELTVPIMPLEKARAAGLYEVIGETIDNAYQQRLRALAMQPSRNNRDLKIVYTPLHGTGNKPVRRILKDLGFQHVQVVQEQEKPDPDFSTVRSPNPEEHEAFTLAIEMAEQTGADLIMGTDPDADRVGVVVRDETGEFSVLTGNQLGALFLEYILSQRKERGELPDNGVVIKTIVTSELGAKIANHYGVETVNTLTGFKFIAEKIKQYAETGEKTFLFGYEESYGYLIGDFCRDKDAVQACMVAAEMAAYYKKRGLTLYQALKRLFDQYGTHMEELVSLTLKGVDGIKRMQAIMDRLRQSPLREVGGIPVREQKDYSRGIEGLPKANVLKYNLEDDSWFAIRPSGTEPKIKFYFASIGENNEEAQAKLETLQREVMRIVQQGETS